MDTVSSGVYLSKDEHFQKCVTLHFLAKKELKKNVSMYRVLGHLIETPPGVPWDTI